jgi:hypothetical protein
MTEPMAQTTIDEVSRAAQNGLTPSDLEYFANLGIREELLIEAGIRRVTDREARDQFGIRFDPAKDVAGILFPYYSPETGNRVTARLRRENPERDENGKAIDKYLSPYGDNRHLFFPPGARELLADPGTVIVLVESEKAALALTAWARRMGIKLLAAACGGCWGWRSQHATSRLAPNGERVDVSGPVDDLKFCNGRKLYLLLDSNTATNPKVGWARIELTVEMNKPHRNCTLLICDLPVMDGVNGPDDFIREHGDSAMAEVFAVAYSPADKSIDEAATGSMLLRDVEQLVRRFLILPEKAYLPLALWIIATYAAIIFYVFPYLGITSPTKRCGKTRVLEICGVLCANALQITSPTAATLFRLMATMPTLLVDEVEALKAKNLSEVNQTVLSILNVGYKKGATVPRCEPPKNEVRHFPVYGPKALAAIGTLPGTVADRSISIPIQRRIKAQNVDRFSEQRTPKEAEPIKKRMANWVKSQRKNIQKTYEGLPDLEFLSDRDAELWTPLFAICAVAAPERVAELKQCAEVLTKTKADDDVADSLPLKLLADVRSVWPEGEEKMLTETLLSGLKAIAESPWNERDHELNPTRLAAILRPFGVQPRQVGAGKGLRGYVWGQFADAFLRYLPESAPEPATPATTRANTGENVNSAPATAAQCSGSKNGRKPA